MLTKQMPYKKFISKEVPLDIMIKTDFYLQDGNVFFPLFDVDFFEENEKLYFNSEPFLNCIFLVKHIDLDLVEQIEFPLYMDVIKQIWTENSIYLFIEIEVNDFDNAYSYLFEFDFIHI